ESVLQRCLQALRTRQHDPDQQSAVHTMGDHIRRRSDADRGHARPTAAPRPQRADLWRELPTERQTKGWKHTQLNQTLQGVNFTVLRRIGGKSGSTGREAGKLVVAKPTIHLSLLSPCILLILPLSGQAMTP